MRRASVRELCCLACGEYLHTLALDNALTIGPSQSVKLNARRFATAQDRARVENFDANELFVLADIQRDFFRQPNATRFVLPVYKSNVEGIDFRIVGQLHAFSVSKVKRVDSYNNDFLCRLGDYRCDLFNAVVLALLFAIERKVVAAHFASAFRWPARALSDRFDHLALSRAAFRRLLFRVIRKANAFRCQNLLGARPIES